MHYLFLASGVGTFVGVALIFFSRRARACLVCCQQQQGYSTHQQLQSLLEQMASRVHAPPLPRSVLHTMPSQNLLLLQWLSLVHWTHTTAQCPLAQTPSRRQAVPLGTLFLQTHVSQNSSLSQWLSAVHSTQVGLSWLMAQWPLLHTASRTQAVPIPTLFWQVQPWDWSQNSSLAQLLSTSHSTQTEMQCPLWQTEGLRQGIPSGCFFWQPVTSQ